MRRGFWLGVVCTAVACVGGAAASVADAANSLTLINYYVQAPTLEGSPTLVTPESATVTGAVDTGGEPESLLPVPAAGLSWTGYYYVATGATYATAAPPIVGEKWSDSHGTFTTGSYAPVDGLPVTGVDNVQSFSFSDSSLNAGATQYTAASATGANVYSSVSVEYDPLSDYEANNDSPGYLAQFSSPIEVPDATSLASVSLPIGAFGQAAQKQTGNMPLTPGTTYVYFIVQLPGATDAATEVNLAGFTPAKTPTNPELKCLPNNVIAAEPTLSAYSASTQITAPNATTTNGVTTTTSVTAPALDGPCTYFWGSPSGTYSYSSPNGEFTTPSIGRLEIARNAKAVANSNKVELMVSNASAYKASGALELTNPQTGKVWATAKFAFQPNRKGYVKLSIRRLGKVPAAEHMKADLTLTSNWDQPTATTTVKL